MKRQTQLILAAGLLFVGAAVRGGDAQDSLETLVDGAFRSCMGRYWSARTSLIYACDLNKVKKASTFKNGIHDWSKDAKAGDGYGIGMADCAITGAIGLSGCVDRWETLLREGVDVTDPRMVETEEWAVKIARGLLNLTSRHPYVGFVARGLCEEDGTSICSISSIDQHTHWVHGLYRYSHSSMARPELVREWRQRIAEVAARMERTVRPETDYNFGLCDGRKDPRGICRMWWPNSTNATNSCRLPSIYAAAYDATGDRHWKDLYEQLADKACADAAFMTKNKAEDPRWKWITPTYTLLQMNVSIEVVLGCERDPVRRAGLLEGLRQSAAEADFRAKDMWNNPTHKWYGMAPDAELALAQLTANNEPYDETELMIFTKALRTGHPDGWWSLRTTHLFAAYWRARLRGLIPPNFMGVYPPSKSSSGEAPAVSNAVPVAATNAAATVRVSRDLPILASVDVCVIGGGPAGVSAAVTAAEAGRRVLLIEQTGAFGGAGTIGGVAELMNFDDGVHFLAGGFGKRVYESLFGPSTKLRRKCHEVKTEDIKRLYDRLIVQSGADFRFYTRLVDVVVREGRVQYAVVSDPEGMKAVSADVFVDCTGSGFLCALAGAAFDYGDEKGVPMAATLCSEWGGVDFARKRGDDGRFAALAHKEGVLSQCDTVLPGIRGNYAEIGVGLGNVGHVFGVDDRDAKSLTQAMVKGRTLLAEYESYYRRYVPGCEKATLVRTADWLGVRASRRIRCEKTLTEEDFDRPGRFADEIGRYSYPIDSHPKTADAKGMEGFAKSYARRHVDGVSYSIPYGALVPVGLRNVLVAGRAIGADSVMQASVRVIPACYITGQAAGLAAALAVEKICDTRSVPIRELRTRLRAVGAYLSDGPVMEGK